MERGKLIYGLKALEQQIAEVLDQVDATRDQFLPFVDRESQNRDGLQSLVHTLQTEVMQLRHLYQQVIYKTALLTEVDEGKNYYR
jgi:hypothetical protein